MGAKSGEIVCFYYVVICIYIHIYVVYCVAFFVCIQIAYIMIKLKGLWFIYNGCVGAKLGELIINCLLLIVYCQVLIVDC